MMYKYSLLNVEESTSFVVRSREFAKFFTRVNFFFYVFLGILNKYVIIFDFGFSFFSNFVFNFVFFLGKRYENIIVVSFAFASNADVFSMCIKFFFNSVFVCVVCLCVMVYVLGLILIFMFCVLCLSVVVMYM